MTTYGREPGGGPANGRDPDYVLRLYVGGSGARSTSAVQLVKGICDEKLAGNYQLEVIDLHQQLPLAERDHVVAAPTLVKKEPLPSRKTIGALTRERVLAGLGLT